jgi:hypothetical protein
MREIVSVKSYMRVSLINDCHSSSQVSLVCMKRKFPAPVVGHYVIILFLMQNPSKYFVPERAERCVCGVMELADTSLLFIVCF